MFPNLLPADGVALVVGNRFDAATVFQQAKVMRGSVVGEAHHVIAAVNDAGVVCIWTGLGNYPERKEQEGKCNGLTLHGGGWTSSRERCKRSSWSAEKFVAVSSR